MSLRLFSILCWVIVTGCASLPPPAPNTVEADCLVLYEQADRVLAQSDSQPSSPKRISGFPYYRVDRFLAEFRQRELDESETAVWLTRLSELDLEARRIAGQSWLQDLERCASVLRAFDLAQPQRLAMLKARASVPDDYITAARIIGLYPLVALPVRGGIKRLHEEFRQTYDLPLDSLPRQGQLIRYGLISEPGQPPNPPEITRDPLGIPNPTPAQWPSLFARYAPSWEIDIAADYDRPGRPVWRSPNQPGVDARQPLTFYYPSYTWWQDRPVLQLNYLVWFDQRPLESSFDILGGALDAVLWRVTLGPDQQPLLYDSIHACGCYHLFFPTPALRLQAEALALPEPPFVAQTAPIVPTGQRMVVRIASGTHYIERIYPDSANPSDQAYRLVYYAELYQTPALTGDHRGGGHRSLFGPDGIVLGSERAERSIFWPLGVAEPGAMRERGRHAVAFVGRRHFDDARLLETLFEPAN